MYHILDFQDYSYHRYIAKFQKVTFGYDFVIIQESRKSFVIMLVDLN